MNPVSNQILGYSYRLGEGEGVPDAIDVARRWLQEIFRSTWWPDDSIRYLVHHGSGASCDAVKIAYRASDATGPLGITVVQTLFFIIVTVDAGSTAKQSVIDVGRRLFSSAQRLNLTVTTREPTGIKGRQDSSGVPYREYDWLDTIQWWSDDKVLGFEMLKRTGPGQGTIVRPEFEANRAWFAKFN